jgi:transposase
MKIIKQPVDTEPELACSQIAAHFHVGDATVRRWLSEGMPAKKYNARLFRYKLSEVKDWLNAREKQRVAQAAEESKRSTGVVS